jgi:hypothetical protein
MQGGKAILHRMKVIEDTRDFAGSLPRYGNVPFLRVD